MTKALAAATFLLALAGAAAWAQVFTGTPQPTALVCAYNTSPPTPSSGKFYYIQCDSSGRIIVQ